MNILDYVIMIFLELPLGALCGSFMLGNILLSIFFSFNFAKTMESKGYVKNIKKLKKSIWYTIIVQSILTILLLSVIYLKLPSNFWGFTLAFVFTGFCVLKDNTQNKTNNAIDFIKANSDCFYIDKISKDFKTDCENKWGDHYDNGNN